MREYTLKELVRLLDGRFEIVDLMGQKFVNGFFCLLPVQLVLKGTCSALKRFGAQRLTETIYYEGSGPEVRPASDFGWAIPQFWVLRCRKR